LKAKKHELSKIVKNLDIPEEISKRHTGIAFVVFDDRKDMAQIIDNFKISNLERVFAYITTKFFKC